MAGIYLFMGARMAWWACGFVYSGKSFNELPRYRYQRIRWNKAGLRSEQLSIQVEILLQGCANATILALPALLVASYSANPFGIAALVGVVLWVLAYVFESLADAQKARFGRMNARQGVRGRTCDIGLWRYSRHPNYFGQWMQWNALIVMVIPILIDRWDDTSLWAWVLVVAGILAASASMYYTLVVFTGANHRSITACNRDPIMLNTNVQPTSSFPAPPTSPNSLDRSPGYESGSGVASWHSPADSFGTRLSGNLEILYIRWRSQSQVGVRLPAQ